MGEIVAACGTVHAPQLIIRPPDEKPEMLDASIAAMRELGKILDETKPDVILFLGSDHLETFSMKCIPTFAIIAGKQAIAEFAGRNYELPIHLEMAEDLLDKLIHAGFDIAYSADAVLGHTFAVPFEYLIEKRRIPVIPFHTNVYMPPLPTVQRCAALGRAMAEIIKGRPERVAIIASGGMSHYPGTSKYPRPEFDFDRWMISQLEIGNIDAVLSLTPEQLDEAGNTEMLSWAIMLGAIGPVPGELLQYTPTWHHGHCMMRFIPARERKYPPFPPAKGNILRSKCWKNTVVLSSRMPVSSSTSIRPPPLMISIVCFLIFARTSRFANALSTISMQWRPNTDLSPSSVKPPRDWLTSAARKCSAIMCRSWWRLEPIHSPL